MQTVNIHQAKTHLSRLVARAAQGECFVIARAGKPLVRVVPGGGRVLHALDRQPLAQDHPAAEKADAAALFGADE